jgi:hypothetical protein
MGSVVELAGSVEDLTSFERVASCFGCGNETSGLDCGLTSPFSVSRTVSVRAGFPGTLESPAGEGRESPVKGSESPVRPGTAGTAIELSGEENPGGFEDLGCGAEVVGFGWGSIPPVSALRADAVVSEAMF